MLRAIRDRFKQTSEGNPVYLVAGLGNPGRQHRQNRHNAGFILLDRLADRLGVNFSRLESNALVAKANYEDRRLILAKPQTYMNRSGHPVASLQRYYKVPLGNLLVVYDDVDLDLGVLRIRSSGGSAGQKGIGSVIDRLGTQEFSRMRLGIGRPPGRMDAAAYVLQNFSDAEAAQFEEVLASAVEAVLTFVTRGVDSAMNEFNGPV